MYAYGTESLSRLATITPNLRSVAHRVMSYQIMDLTIVCGQRGKEEQALAYVKGYSKKQWPDSLHNATPFAHALDFAPWTKLPSGLWGINWDDTHAFAMLGGLFLAAGAATGTHLRYGGDWNRNGSTEDQILMDWGHIEEIL